MYLKSLLVWSAFKRFLDVNRDLFIRTVGLTFAFGFFYSQSSKNGELVLAANVVLLQFLNWMSYGIDGFAFAAESIVGKYHGRDDRDQLGRAVRLSFLWGLVLALIYTFAYGVFGDYLLRIFTDEEPVINVAKSFLWWMVIFPVFSFPSYIWDGIYIGFTASRSMRNTMLVSMLVFGLVFWVSRPYGNHGLWITLLALMVARGISQAFLYQKYGRSLT